MSALPKETYEPDHAYEQVVEFGSDGPEHTEDGFASEVAEQDRVEREARVLDAA